MTARRKVGGPAIGAYPALDVGGHVAERLGDAREDREASLVVQERADRGVQDRLAGRGAGSRLGVQRKNGVVLRPRGPRRNQIHVSAATMKPT